MVYMYILWARAKTPDPDAPFKPAPPRTIPGTLPFSDGLLGAARL
jgi:hypothetical protein